MKTKKRLLATLLTLAMVFSMLPMGALAETVTEPPVVAETTVQAPVGPQDPGAGTRAVVESNVAKIGETGYDTFADALTVANDNPDATTITVLKDCTYAGGSINSPLTIEGGGKTLTIDRTDTAYINVKPSCDTAINNLNITSNVKDYFADVFHVQSKLTMTGCTVTANTPATGNGMFKIMDGGNLTLVSGTYTASAGGNITSGASFSMKTGDETNGVNIIGGTIRLDKDKFITLSADSTVPTNSFNIQTANNAQANDKIVDGTNAPGVATALAGKITVNDGTDWAAVASGNNIVLERTTSKRYVKDGGNDTTGDGSLANPYATLQKAYGEVSTNGEIRVLSDLTADAATSFSATDKTVTVTSYADATTPKTDGGWTMKRGTTFKGELLCINAGTVNLKAFTLDGKKDLFTAENPLVSVGANGTLNLNAGATLQNNNNSGNSDGDGGAISTAGTVNMHTGAKISGNEAKNHGSAVIVTGSNANAKFVMDGGEISGNKTTDGSGTIMSYTSSTGAVKISGGEITGNTAAVYGGAIHGGLTAGTIAITGTANIHDNVSTNGYAIYPNASTVTVGGTAKITGNTNGAGTASNLYALSSKTFAIDPDLSTGANIGVTGAAGDITTATAVEGDKQYVHSDHRQLKVVFDTNKLKLVDDPNVYASASGNDASDGSKEHPYATIGKAYTEAATSGTIYVMTDLAVPQTTFATDKAVTIEGYDNTVRTLMRSDSKMLLVNAGSVTLKNIKITDPANGNSAFDGSPVCITTPGKFVMDTGSGIENTKSNYAAVYIISGEMEMKDGSSITGNTNCGTYVNDSGTIAGAGGAVTLEGHSIAANFVMSGGTITGNKAAKGGGVYASTGTTTVKVKGNVKITGNTLSGDTTASNLQLTNATQLTVTGDLNVDARIGVTSNVTTSGTDFGAYTDSDKAYISNITQDGVGDNPFAGCEYQNKLIWTAADKPWLRYVAYSGSGYGWNDDGNQDDFPGIGIVSGGGTPNDGNPNGILIDTPAKLYSLAWAIRNDFDPDGNNSAKVPSGAKYANGCYYVTRDLDMTGFTWIPIGTNTIPFTGVFEGKDVRTITGINHKAGLTENGLFGVVAAAGNRTHPGGGNWVAPYTTTLIQNIIVDGSKTTRQIWLSPDSSGTTTHMGGIAAKATDATIQNCAVKNLSLKISDTAAHVHVGGIVGETTACKLLNNAVVYTDAPIDSSDTERTFTANAGEGAYNSHAGGIVGKATTTTISGNTVGGDNRHYVEIVADPADPANPADELDATSYAGGVVGYMDGGSIDNETDTHLNAIKVCATTATKTSKAYAGGVAGYMAGAAAMTNCTPGATNSEKHSITASVGGILDPAQRGGNHYAGGLVGGMEGTSSITNSTIGASGWNACRVNADVGTKSVAGGLVGTMTANTSLTDCNISDDSIDSVKVTANGAAGTAGGLVGTAMDARVIKCNAQNITIAGIKASGGLAGTFTATSKAGLGVAHAAGVMAQCYARNCDVTGTNHCGMIHTLNHAYILGCYATKGTNSSGNSAFNEAGDSVIVGCYTTANTAMATSGGTYANAYYLGSGTAVTNDDATAIGLTAKTMTAGTDTAFLGVLNDELNTGSSATNYKTMTGIRMSYMSGNSKEISGNYNYPVYAAWMLTVNTAPGSVYGSYTVKADGKTISAPGATGFNQYWVGKDATVTITGTQSAYADGAITYTMTTNEAGTTTNADVTDVAMTFDKTATITFTPNLYPGWTINTDLTDQAIYDGVVSGELGKTENKLTGNVVYSEESTVTPAWTPNTRTIKTIFVTASTADGASNPTISAYTAYGWQVASGGVGKAYVQLTNVYGANAVAVSAIVNSFAFAANRASTGDVTVDVQVYVDENVRGTMYFNGSSVYELAGSPASYSSAKLLAETSTFGAKKGHLVVIGDGAEHQFLKNTVVTNAWTAAVTSNPSANAVSTWSWDVTGASDASYLQSEAAWAYPAPDNSGSHATYHYMGHFDDTNAANMALIEYDGLSALTTGWQAYSALSSGTVTCYVDVPIAPPPTPVYPTPAPKPQPPKTDPGTGNTEVSVPVKPVTKGDTSSATVPEKSVSDAIAAAEKEAAKTGGSASVTITVDAPKDAKTVETTLSSKSLSAVADGKTEGLKISTPVADLFFDSEALKNIAGMAGKDVKISATKVETKALTDAQKSQVGDAPVFDFTITTGDKTISNFNGGTATVSVPYTLKEGKNPEFVTVWLLDDAGKLIPIEAKYKDGKITFETGHFSRYAIGYLPFTDVNADWAYESIVYAYQNKLFSGVGDNKFAPTANMNRAMLWSVLYRMAGSPDKTENPATWYAGAQKWAMANSISDGTNPDGNITREQLATILFRYKKATATAADMSKFTDTDDISGFAKDGMSWAVETQILQGFDGKLTPQATATRAEVAAMLQRFATPAK